MSEQVAPTVFDLHDTKLYQLCRSTRILEGLVPELPTQISVEMDLSERFPREDEDGESTRILINYTNMKGNSTLFKVVNHERMTSQVDIDDFLVKYADFMKDTNLPEDPLPQMTTLVMAALTFSVGTLLGLDDEDGAGIKQAKHMAQWFIGAATSIIYDDPLDVVIAVKEVPSSHGNGSFPTIVAIWCVKSRQ